MLYSPNTNITTLPYYTNIMTRNIMTRNIIINCFIVMVSMSILTPSQPYQVIQTLNYPNMIANNTKSYLGYIYTDYDYTNANDNLAVVSSTKQYESEAISTILSLVKKLNEGNRIVNDMCEMLEEKVGIISGSDKPNCRYNASFISNNSINMFDIGENVRSFLLTRKKENCKAEKLECGELTVILKLVDLINSIVHISLELHSPQELVVNIETISFDELFTLYVSSLDNYEVLSNITLKKQRANVILDRERLRIKQIQGRGSMQRLTDDINIYFGEPLKESLGYVGNTIGSTLGNLLGSTIDGTSPSLTISNENKLILLVLIAIYIRK